MAYKIWKKPPSEILSQKEVDFLLRPTHGKVYSKSERDRLAIVNRELDRQLRKYEKLLKSAIAYLPTKEQQISYLTHRVISDFSKERFGEWFGIGELFRIESNSLEVSIYSYAIHDWPVPNKFYLQSKETGRLNFYRIDLNSKTKTIETITKRANPADSFEYEFELTFHLQKTTYKVTEWTDIPYELHSPELNDDIRKIKIAVEVLEENRGTKPLGVLLYEDLAQVRPLIWQFAKCEKFVLETWDAFEEGREDGL